LTCIRITRYGQQVLSTTYAAVVKVDSFAGLLLERLPSGVYEAGEAVAVFPPVKAALGVLVCTK